ELFKIHIDQRCPQVLCWRVPHRIERNIDTTCLSYNRPQMLINSLLIKGINLRCLGIAASRNDVPGNRLDRRQAAPGEKKPGSFACESTCDSAADLAACPIDHCDLVFQFIHYFSFNVEKLHVNYLHA